MTRENLKRSLWASVEAFLEADNSEWTPVIFWHDKEEGDYEQQLPGDDREVLVFLNGHCGINDMETRAGGGWGIRMGWFDHEKGYWRVGSYENRGFVTHWKDLPPPPPR